MSDCVAKNYTVKGKNEADDYSNGNSNSNGCQNTDGNTNAALKGYMIVLAGHDYNIMVNKFWTVPTYNLVCRVFMDISVCGMNGMDFFNNSINGFCPDRKPIEGTDEFTRGCIDKSDKMYSCSFHIPRSDLAKLMDTGAKYLRDNPRWKGHGDKWLKAVDLDLKWTKHADYKSLCESDYDVALDIFLDWVGIFDEETKLERIIFINITNHPQMVITKSN